MRFFMVLLVLGCLSHGALAQGTDSLNNRLSPEQVVDDVVLNTLSTEFGSDFMVVWGAIGPDVRKIIAQHIVSLRGQQRASRRFIQSYLKVLINALTVENASVDRIKEYLNVTTQVIKEYDNKSLLAYFKTVNNFFELRALAMLGSHKTYIKGSDYSFEYIAPPEIEEEVVEEEPEEEEYEDDEDRFDEWDEDADDSDWDTEWDEEEEEIYDDEEEIQEDEVEAIVGGNDLPEIMGAVIHFYSADINISTSYDSVFLENTKGVFLINQRQFVGENGKINWSSAGLSADSVYVNFKDYSLDLRKSSFSAESANLTYKGRLDESVPGFFEFKSTRHDSVRIAKYPRFISYHSNIKINGLGEGVVYKGGFSLNGPKINSSSLFGEESLIEVQDKSQKKFRARAKIFEIQDSTVTTDRSAVVIYQGNDSIAHPAVRLNYNVNSKFLTVQKEKGSFKNTPYTASFFNIDFTADILRWDLASDSLDASILQARRIVPAYFESSDHYNAEDYHSLGDKLYDFNPLGIAVYYAQREGVDEYYVDDLARHYKKDPRLIKGAMQFLAQKGLIGFDSKNSLVTIKPKAYHLFDSKFDRKDFDNIIIASVTHEAPNATINFKNQYMTIRGVESFKVSDSLNVTIVPDSSEITLRRNRDFSFNGKIYAGNFEYVGRDFTFKYDSFLIYLNEIDSIEFFIQDENSRGNSGRRKVDNALVAADTADINAGLSNNLQSSSGTLYINKPGNKSSKKKYLNYPRFNSEKGAVVYFDRKEILDGIYDRSVYFMVPPFDLDSLGGSDPKAIEFEGSFISSGMFPSFKEKLSIRSDYSLGFEHDIPPEGYQLYEGAGKLFNKLKMDNMGLRGNGRIDFLSTSLESEDFTFYPDSVVAQGEYVEVREEEHNGIIFPQASLKKYEMKWLPKKDSMYLKNVEEPIHFYNETASLDGAAIITNKGVFGKGTMVSRGSEFKSDDITLEHNNFGARHAQFELKSDNPEKPALSGDDVRLKFDLVDNYADISPEIEGQAAIAFPYAQFNTSITKARWDLDEQKITMTKPEGVPLESSYFYTTREDLDSLSFNATEAVYDINTLELTVSGIPYIIVADAKITPENNEVLILENSKIGRLTNTTIVLDTLNGYHRLTEGVIDIKSRNEFSGYATYQFSNALGDTIPIKMENFRLEEIEVEGTRRKGNLTEKHSVANGTISESQNVLISPGMYYKGDLTMYAHKPAMELDGYIKLDLNEPGYDTWIQQSSNGDEKQVVIDFDNSTTEDGRRLEAGLHFSSGDNSMYSTFVTEKLNPDDDDFFLPSGLLFYDELKNEYAIEDTAKASGNVLAGKVMRINPSTSEIKFEGPAQFMTSTKDVAVNATVIGNGNMNDNVFNINTFITLNFTPVPTQAFDMMAVDILDVITNLGAPEGTGDATQLLYKLADIAGERAAREFEELSLQEYVALAGFVEETTTSMVFTNVDFKWSADYNAFYNEGKLGLSGIQKNDLNGAFDGFFEIKRNPEDGAPVVNLFLKASASSWYYFSYEDNRLLIFSSNNAFNGVISKKSNGAKAKIGELVFAPADRAETLNFINRFRLQYYGIEDPYDLASDIEEEEGDESEDGFGGKEDDDDGFEDDDDGF